jgi:hypothetical protein
LKNDDNLHMVTANQAVTLLTQRTLCRGNHHAARARDKCGCYLFTHGRLHGAGKQHEQEACDFNHMKAVI